MCGIAGFIGKKKDLPSKKKLKNCKNLMEIRGPDGFNFKTIENKNTLQENIMFGKEIELKNIFYRYDNKENFVLNDINLKIKKN